MAELLHGEVVEKLRKALEMGDAPVLPGFSVIVNKTLLKEAIEAIEDLNADVKTWERIFDMLNDRENRHHYLEWWRKRYGESDLAYPDGDQIYKDFWEIMHDLRSVCSEPNMFELVFLNDKWGFRDEQESGRLLLPCEAR